MSSIRHVTTQQFSPGTTIDGDRLEKALQDLEDYIAGVPDGDFNQRWLQNQIVLKYLPYTAEADTNVDTNTTGAVPFVAAPWLDVYNTGAGTTNAYRLKGNRLPWQDEFQSNAQVAWTASLAVGDEPAIIESIDVSLNSHSSEYVNDFHYGSSAPPNKTANAPIDNIHLQITLDNPYIPNIQVGNSVLFHRYNFNVTNSKITARSLAYPSPLPSDINPTIASVSSMGNGGLQSLAIEERDLNIPLPPLSRIRFSLVLPNDPDPSTGGGFGYDPWGFKPWQTMIPTMSITLLERLERD